MKKFLFAFLFLSSKIYSQNVEVNNFYQVINIKPIIDFYTDDKDNIYALTVRYSKERISSEIISLDSKDLDMLDEKKSNFKYNILLKYEIGIVNNVISYQMREIRVLTNNDYLEKLKKMNFEKFKDENKKLRYFCDNKTFNDVVYSKEFGLTTAIVTKGKCNFELNFIGLNCNVSQKEKLINVINISEGNNFIIFKFDEKFCIAYGK